MKHVIKSGKNKERITYNKTRSKQCYFEPDLC